MRITDTTEGFLRVRELFSDALAISSPEPRRGFLDNACSEDSALRQEVESLLAMAERADAFMEARLPGCGADTPTGPVGTRIGRYRVIEFLGEGGFGEVYRVEQTEPLHRELALKVIKPGMDSREVIARFEAERQALALMDHPNVARVYDAGMTERGRPYFAMELAMGKPITVFCNDHRATIDERLRLFRQVCEGVRHAHQKGLIHRDLKPSNIVVVRDSPVAQPVPKIIDFGIAKSLQGSLTDLTLLTRAAVFLGTPAYMSPEQVAFGGEQQDTRTDVYALGVVLYELLAGARPFDPHTFETLSFEEVCRTIREIEPARPSARLHALDETRGSVAEQRVTDPSTLERTLRGDLDWIVMKAIAKDRNRRYMSVSDLMQDIDRYGEHLPVLARPPSPTYRLRKYARRHRLGVTAAAVVFAALMAGFTLALAGYRHSVAGEQLANESRNRAQELAGFMIQELHPDLLAAGRRDSMVESAKAAVQYYASLPEELRDVSTLRQHARALEALAEAYGFMSFIGDAFETELWEALNKAGKLWRRVAEADPNDGEAAVKWIRPEFWERYEEVTLTWNTVEWNTSMGPGKDKIEVLASHSLDQIRTLHRRFPDTPAVKRELSQMLRDLSMELFGPDPVATGDEACQLLREMISADPENDALKRDLAQTLVWGVGTACSRTGIPETAVEKDSEALALAESLLSKDPTNRQFLDLVSHTAHFLARNMIRAYPERQAGILESVHTARSHLATALAFDPSDSHLLFRDAELLANLAVLQVAQREYSEARVSYALALARLDSLTTEIKYTDALRSRWIGMDGAVAARSGVVEDARARLDEYRRVYPDPGAGQREGWLHRQCGILLRLRAWPELETRARALITEIENLTEEMIAFPVDELLLLPASHFYLASALLGQGRSAEGQSHLQKAVDLYRSGASRDFYRDDTIEFVWQAAESLGALLLTNGDRAHASETLAWVLEQRKRWVRAGALLESRIAAARCSFLLARALDPADPNSTARRTELLQRAAELLGNPEAVPVLTPEEQAMRAAVEEALGTNRIG